MKFAEGVLSYPARAALQHNKQAREAFINEEIPPNPFDPELLYVECRLCGKPVLWGKGHTTGLIEAAGIEQHLLDERCLIVSDGCAACMPEDQTEYAIAVVRVAGLSPEEAVHMVRPAGTA